MNVHAFPHLHTSRKAEKNHKGDTHFSPWEDATNGATIATGHGLRAPPSPWDDATCHFRAMCVDGQCACGRLVHNNAGPAVSDCRPTQSEFPHEHGDERRERRLVLETALRCCAAVRTIWTIDTHCPVEMAPASPHGDGGVRRPCPVAIVAPCSRVLSWGKVCATFVVFFSAFRGKA